MTDTQTLLPNPADPPANVVGTSLAPTLVRPTAPFPEATPIMTSPQTVPPVPQVSAPTLGSAIEPSAQISSRFLQNLQAVSPEPFQGPSATPAPAPGILIAPAISPAPPVSVPSAVPAEPATMTMKPPGGSAAPPPKGVTVPFWSRYRGLLLAGGGLLLVIILGLVAWIFLRPKQEEVALPPAARQIELTYWGLWEPAEIMQPLIDQYQQLNPNVKISYVQQRSDQYRQRLQAAIRDGTGPDIFRFHNTWVPMLATDLAPAPSSTLAPAQLQQNYYPLMAKEMVLGQEVIGVPLMYEGLALLYNQSMLEAANAQPPSDWEQVRALATSLTIRTNGRLERGGIALGTTSNVDHFSDILGLMILQNSAQPGNPVGENAEHALEFYTIFNRVDKVWDDTMPASTLAFANEQVAMILAPSWRIFEIQRANPNLRFGVAPTPRLSGERLAWATYWAEGVSRASSNNAEAWKFLAWLSQPEQLRQFHSAATSVRGFGELYPRVEMASELGQTPLVAPYLEDALYADSWFLASATHDDGLNDQMTQYYTDAVNEMLVTGNAANSLNKILPGIQQVLARYNISAEHQRPSAPLTNPAAPAGQVSLAP